MPMYYFHLRDSDTLRDPEGTELPNLAAAREHATTVARELKFRNEADWADWTMTVKDDDDAELFSFRLSDVDNGNDKG